MIHCGSVRDQVRILLQWTGSPFSLKCWSPRKPNRVNDFREFIPCLRRKEGWGSVGFAMQANDPPRHLRFGVFEADLRTGELTKHGKRLRLQDQPFQLLAMLLEKPGELVTREELRDRLWPQTIVDFDHGLNKAISKIREALGDSPENPRFVETVARRGYRFLADVAVVGDGQPEIVADDLARPADPGLLGLTDAETSPTRPLRSRAWRLFGFGFCGLVVVDSLPPESFLTHDSLLGRAAPGKPFGRCFARLLRRGHDRRIDYSPGADQRITRDLPCLCDDL
jgi:DNA-binding winged helix-turn-helix (wHTH) protein